MLQELLHGQPVRHVNRVLEEQGGDCTSTQPQGTASVQGRKAQTYGPVRDKERANQDVKTTKRTAIARGQSNPKRGRQGQSHLSPTLDASGAGCRDYKSGMRQSPGSVRRGRAVNPTSRHSTRPKQEGFNIRPGEGEGKESTRTERPPSVPQ